MPFVGTFSQTSAADSDSYWQYYQCWAIGTEPWGCF